MFGTEFRLDTGARADVARDGDAVAVTRAQRRRQHASRALRRTCWRRRVGRPNVSGLGLEPRHRSSSTRPASRCSTARRCSCGASSIFIAGDANDDVPMLHEAADEGKIAGDNAARFPDVRAGDAACAAWRSCSATRRSRSSAAATTRWRDDRTSAGQVSIREPGAFAVMLQNRGRLRVYAEPRTERFLGAEMFGPAAEHIGHLLAWARQMDLTISQMLAMPFYHPVIEEGLTHRAARRAGEARRRRRHARGGRESGSADDLAGWRRSPEPRSHGRCQPASLAPRGESAVSAPRAPAPCRGSGTFCVSLPSSTAVRPLAAVRGHHDRVALDLLRRGEDRLPRRRRDRVHALRTRRRPPRAFGFAGSRILSASLCAIAVYSFRETGS